MPKHKLEFEAIGTRWSIETGEVLNEKVQLRIERAIEYFDITYSRFRDDSLVRRIAGGDGGTYTFPDSVQQIFALYRQLYEATSGKVTPLIGGSLENIGYDKHYSLKTKGFQAAPTWDDIISLSGNEMSVKQGVTIDIGAAGKGYLVDEIARILIAAKVPTFVIDGSGDIYTYNSPERIGLENPYDTTKVIGVATIDNKALCASAVNRRQWADGLHHILDPHTGRPVQDVIATWVIAPTAMRADGLATALFFTDAKSLAHIADFSYAVLRKDGTMLYSKDSTLEMFL